MTHLVILEIATKHKLALDRTLETLRNHRNGRDELGPFELLNNLCALLHAGNAIPLRVHVANGVSTSTIFAFERSNDVLDDSRALIVKCLTSTKLLDKLVVLRRARRDNLIARRNSKLDTISPNTARTTPHYERLPRRLRRNTRMLKRKEMLSKQPACCRRHAQRQHSCILVRQRIRDLRR